MTLCMQLSRVCDFVRLVGRMGGWVTAFAGISVSNYNPWARERGNRLKLEHIVQPVYVPLAILYFAVPFAPNGARFFLSLSFSYRSSLGLATSLILVVVLSPIPPFIVPSITASRIQFRRAPRVIHLRSCHACQIGQKWMWRKSDTLCDIATWFQLCYLCDEVATQ